MKIKKQLCGFFLVGALLMPMKTFALTKEETVYSYLDASGNPYHMNVTNKISFKDSKEVADETELKNILNINGKETFEQKGKKLVWEHKNKDIFYEGTIKKELPIKTEITYYLDGKEMQPKDMAGKKGKVTITFHFSNTEKKLVKVSGKMENLYTPFVMTMGMILDGKTNSSIEVTNGKVVQNGTKSMVVALATPGLYESMGYDELKPLNTISLSYDTTKFSLNSMYLVATPKVFAKTDMEVFEKMDHLYGSVSKLQESMNQLEQGAKDLLTGVSALDQGSQELQMNLKTAVTSVDQLKSGSVEVSDGLKTLREALINAEGLLDTSKSEQLSQIKVQNETKFNHMLEASGKTFEELTIEYNTNLKDYTGNDTSQLLLKSNYEFMTSLLQTNALIDQTLVSINELSTTVSYVLKTTTNALTSLEQGSTLLTSGLGQLQSGLDKLYQGSQQLSIGTKALYDGTKTLSSGVQTFNHEGIGRLSRLAVKAKEMKERVTDLVQLSKNYQGFASDNSNQTIFVSVVKVKK